jgi:dsRNA-specific ribonuclease
MSDSNEASQFNDRHHSSDAEGDADDLNLSENQHQNPTDPNTKPCDPSASASASNHSTTSPPPPLPKLTTPHLPIFPLPPLPPIPDTIIRKKVFTHTSMARIQRAAEGQHAKQKEKGAFEDPIGEPTMHYEKLEFVGDSWVLLCFSFFSFSFLFLFSFSSLLFFSFLFGVCAFINQSWVLAG